MVNWITSLGGIIAGLGQIAQMAPIPPQYSWIPGLVTAAGTALIGLGAKDFNVHSTSQEVRTSDLQQ